MNEHGTPNEERLLDLLEQKDFGELNAKERAFVETQLSATDYALQRRLMTAAADVEYAAPEVRPLVLPTTRATRTVPLYQAIAAVAATIALFLSLWPTQPETASKPRGNGARTSQTDTVIRTQVIVDTVIRYLEHRSSHRTEPAQQATRTDAALQAAQLRLLESGAITLPALTEELVHAKGRSLKDDSATRSLLGEVYVGGR
jgi:hypothetical protein